LRRPLGIELELSLERCLEHEDGVDGGVVKPNATCNRLKVTRFALIVCLVAVPARVKKKLAVMLSEELPNQLRPDVTHATAAALIACEPEIRNDK
jgi:hypothetical protein